MMTCTSAVRPPAPTPCRARHAISQPIECERPASSDPITKMSSPIWTSSLRSKRSASLPQIGVLTVSASSVEVTTQV
jgi:hypothetical protein